MKMKKKHADEAKQILLATKLAEYGARAGVICATTMVSSKKVPAIISEVRGAAKRPGRPPSLVESYYDSPDKIIEATKFVAIYQRSELENEAERLLSAYRVYTHSFKNPSIHIDYAYYTIQWLEEGKLAHEICDQCGTTFLQSTAYVCTVCPPCGLLREHYCAVCEKPVQYKPGYKRGRKRCHCPEHQSNARQKQPGGPIYTIAI